MEYISNYEVTICHSQQKELDWYEQGDEKAISPGGQMKNLGH